MVKVYFINGFLEAGKTSFIKELLQQDYFKIPDNTLLLQCEEGDEEYELELLTSNHVTLVNIENEEDFNPDFITNIEKEVKPKRVIVEFNGMWDRKLVKFPWYWDDVIEASIFDASTFEVYSKNMKSIVSEYARNASIAIFNRCDNVVSKLPSYRRILKAVNTNLNIIFKDKNGEINPRFDEDLPYDIHSDHIELDNEKYSVFYLDIMEDVERYINKTVSFVGMVMKKSKDQMNTCIIGRFAMTCCVEDLSVFGFICDYENADQLELDDWVNVTARIDKEYTEKYGVWYPVFEVISLEHCEAPGNEVADIR